MCLDIASCLGVMTCLLHSSCCSCVGTEACEPGTPRQQQSDAAAQGIVRKRGDFWTRPASWPLSHLAGGSVIPNNGAAQYTEQKNHRCLTMNPTCFHLSPFWSTQSIPAHTQLAGQLPLARQD